MSSRCSTRDERSTAFADEPSSVEALDAIIGSSSSSSSRSHFGSRTRSRSPSPDSAPAFGRKAPTSACEGTDEHARPFTSMSLNQVQQRGRKLAVRAGQKVVDVMLTTKSLAGAFVRNPRIVAQWYQDIRDAVVHFVQWTVTGFRLFGADVRASFYLTKRILRGYPLTVRERQLLVRTTSDCLKLIPFSFFIIVPFAELALPFVLRLFPNMLPSTFFQQKYDNATLARKLKAKEEMAGFWQNVVHQRTKEISESNQHQHADKARELKEFQDKLMEGQEYPTLKEILRFSKLFQEEFNLKNMSPRQLSAMSKMLGFPQAKSWWPGHLEVQLRHHVTQLRREDRDYLWEGIENLTKAELIEACQKRAIRFHDMTEEEMRRDLARWLELSANQKNIPTSLLLWIQSFYLRTGSHQEEVICQLQLTRATPAVPEADPEEAFSSMAERQKAYSQSAQQRLEEVRTEFHMVVQGSGDAEERTRGAAFEDEQLSKKQMLDRCRNLDQTLRLYKEVVVQQKGLLDEQLRFLATMRDNRPTQNKDADVILLDQSVRLMEMMRSFERNVQEIESRLSQLDPDQLDPRLVKEPQADPPPEGFAAPALVPQAIPPPKSASTEATAPPEGPRQPAAVLPQPLPMPQSTMEVPLLKPIEGGARRAATQAL